MGQEVSQIGNDLEGALCYGSGSSYRIHQLVDEASGMKYVKVVSYDELSSVCIYNFGATVTSWIVNNQEQLFVSNSAIFNSKKAIRGGIPLVFPQFGTKDGSLLSQHGFARNSEWIYINDKNYSKCSSQCATVSFKLESNDDTIKLWPNHFKCIYTITLKDNQLYTKLSCENTATSESESANPPFIAQSLLHTYLRVSNINDIEVEGLNSRHYYDQLENKKSYETRERVKVFREIDRIMSPTTTTTSVNAAGAGAGAGVVNNKDSDIILHDHCYSKNSNVTVDAELQQQQQQLKGEHIPLTLKTKKTIRVQKNACITMSTKFTNKEMKKNTAFDEDNEDDEDDEDNEEEEEEQSQRKSIPCDVVFWNAWIAKSKKLADMDDDGYQNYVCIEPGIGIQEPIGQSVEPGCTMHLGQVLTVNIE